MKMKNIDRLKKNITDHQENMPLFDFVIYDENESYTSLMELISEVVSNIYGKTIEFDTLTGFIDWCNEPAFTMKTKIYDSLETFNHGFYGYICKTQKTVFIQSGENRALVDNEIVDLCLMGFEYDDFEFLELNKTYEIDDILENVYLVDKECGD